MGDFSHLNDNGQASMVDISQKTGTIRTAICSGQVKVNATCAASLTEAAVQEITTTARIAGIQAAKLTSQLIPLCHPIALTKANVEIEWNKGESTFFLRTEARTEGKTGVEMEALCAIQIAGLTIYDMVKAVSPESVVGPFQLVEKHGGKNGRWSL